MTFTNSQSEYVKRRKKTSIIPAILLLTTIALGATSPNKQYLTDPVNVFKFISIEDSTKITEDSTKAKHYIGELYAGGVVVRIPLGSTPGLIVSLADLTYGGERFFTWYPKGNNPDILIDTHLHPGHSDGKKNTDAIIKVYGNTVNPYAATLCTNYSIIMNNKNYDDWFLPSIHQLRTVVRAAEILELVLDNQDSDSLTYSLKALPHDSYVVALPFENCFGQYWSSTEASYASVLCEWYYFDHKRDEHGVRSDKECLHKVRAVREFTE